MNILTYNLFQLALLPFFVLNILLRLTVSKENLNSVFQKLGFKISKIKNYDYIVHVASVGELNSINYLRDGIFKNKKILLTCSTLTAYNLAKERKIKVQFLPYDIYPLVKKFFYFNRGSKFIWIDSEIWPNYLRIIEKQNIKNYLINARISKKSYSRWKKIPSFINYLGSKYKYIYASSTEDKTRFENLFQKEINFCGNLKFYQKLNIKKIEVKNITFASIHLREFRQVCKILKGIEINNINNIYLIPRHPLYSKKLKKEIKNHQLINHKIKIINKIGMNKKIYSKSKIVFMGGSLFNHGGQNPLEAAALGSYILSGPFIQNFKEIYNRFSKTINCFVFKEIDHNSIADIINKMVNKNNLIKIKKVKEIFDIENRKLKLIVEKIGND